MAQLATATSCFSQQFQPFSCCRLLLFWAESTDLHLDSAPLRKGKCGFRLDAAEIDAASFVVGRAEPKKWTYNHVLHLPDFLANRAPLSGRSGIVQVCHKTICLQGGERGVEGSFKNYKSGEEILGKLTASWMKSQNLLMFKSYWWILEEKSKNSPAGNRSTGNVLSHPQCPCKKGHSLNSHLGGTLFCPGQANCSWRTPCLYSSLWALNLKAEVVDVDSKLQSCKGTELMYQIRQTNRFLLVHTEQIPLIQDLVQEKEIQLGY